MDITERLQLHAMILAWKPLSTVVGSNLHSSDAREKHESLSELWTTILSLSSNEMSNRF